MKVLIVTPLHPSNKFNGACQRINKVIKRVQSLGNEVTVIYTCQDMEVETLEKKAVIEENLLKEFGSAYVLPSNYKIDNKGKINKLDDFYPVDVESEYLELVEKLNPEIVLVNYVFLSKLLTVAPKHDFEKIIDTHDKLSRAHIYEAEGLDVGFFCTTEDEELKGLKRADKVLCIQDNETKYFSEKGLSCVYTIGHLVEKKYFTPKGFKLPKKIGFLGSNHIFNSKSVESFLLHPEFEGLKEHFEFIFAGGICNNPVVKESGVTLLGRVEFEEDFYNQVDIIINPVTIGTGLKIKTIDALSFGLPVIGTRVAFDGIESPSEFHKANDVNEIFDLIKKVLEEPAVAVKLSNLSKNIFESYRSTVLDAYRKVFLQERGESTKNLIINHVVNFTEPKLESDLYVAQPITMYSFQRAKEYVKAARPLVKVNHHVVKVAGEEIGLQHISDPFVHDIARTIKDEKGFEKFKPLPMLKDILSVAKTFNNDEYVVFTNADISLTPNFYSYLAAKIEGGHDALVINRRTVSKIYSSVEEYDEIVSDFGSSHPGFDCFVFKVEALKKMRFFRTLVGVHLIGRVLLWNLFKFSKNPIIIKNSHLTFHIGDDNAGKDENNHALLVHNFHQAVEVISQIHDSDLEKNINDQANDALKIFYKPNIYRDFPEEKRPIFLHSMFRTGSSYLWSKFEANAKTKCYYEPFHETLNGLTEDNIRKSENDTGSYHGRLGKQSFWSNYIGVLKPKKGVLLYDKKFSYSYYTKNIGLKDQFEYVENLIGNAKKEGNRPVLQFNRTALRQSWFKSYFPRCVNFYIFREPISQFKSYYDSYVKSEKRGFLRTQLAYIDHNLQSDYYKDLEDFVGMPRLGLSDDVAMPNYFSKYDDAIKSYDKQSLFFIFYWDWLVSLMEALKENIEIINMSLLSQSLVYKRKVEARLVKEFVYIDFDDCSLPKEISGCLSCEEYRVIKSTIISQFSSDIILHKEKLLVNGCEDMVDIAINSDKPITPYEYKFSIEDRAQSLFSGALVDYRNSGSCSVVPVSKNFYEIKIKGEPNSLRGTMFGIFECEENKVFVDLKVNNKSIKAVAGKSFPILSFCNIKGDGIKIELSDLVKIKEIYIKWD